MINRKKIVLISLLIIVLSGCKSEPRSSWFFYWELMDMKDSLRIDYPLYYTFSIDKCKCDCFTEGETVNGYLSEWILMCEWEDEFLKNNPTLHARILNDSNVVYDSIYNWNELDFTTEFPDSSSNKSIGNVQKIYLDLND